MFVISNRKAIHCLALLLSPLQTCVRASCRFAMYNEFQWHWRLVLSEEQAGSLQRPDDKQTQPPNCNKTGREGCSLVGRCSLSECLSISLALLSDSLSPSSSLSLFSQFAVTPPAALHSLSIFCLPSSS